MLIAMIAVMFFGGGVQDAVLEYIKSSKAVVKEVIDDPTRRSAINDTLGEMDARTKGRSKSAKAALKKLESEMSEHDLNSAAIDAVFDDYFVALTEYNKDMIDLRFQLKDQLTREEWQELFSGQ